MDLSQKIAAARAKADTAKALLTDDDRAEMVQRAELAQIEAEREEAVQTARRLDLQRRLEKARDVLPEDIEIRGVSPKTFPDTFVVRRDTKAHKQWKASTLSSAKTEARGNKAPMDSEEIALKYAMHVVYDWNGMTNFDAGAEGTANSQKLRAFLANNSGILTLIVDAAGELAGAFESEEAKST